MKKFIFLLVLAIFCLSSTESFAYEYKLRNAGHGFCYSYRNECLQYFTQDENFQFPQDKKVAEERFKRRKEYVEKWYLENLPHYLNPEKENWFIKIPLIIIIAPTIPITFPIFEWIDHKQRSRPEEIERVRLSNIRYEKACEEMHEFIVEDSRFEGMTN